MKTTMQVSVPVSVYGDNKFFMPREMATWVFNLSLQYGYAGSSMSGDGYRGGVSNKENTYIVHNIDPTDASAFKIQFPECRVYIQDLETTN